MLMSIHIREHAFVFIQNQSCAIVHVVSLCKVERPPAETQDPKDLASGSLSNPAHGQQLHLVFWGEAVGGHIFVLQCTFFSCITSSIEACT